MISSNSRSAICFLEQSQKTMAEVAVAPIATAPEDEHPPATHPQGVSELSVLEAELKSYQAAMIEVTSMKEVKEKEGEVAILPQMGDVEPGDVAKSQLQVLVNIQNVAARQLYAQEASLKAQMIASKMMDTCIQIMGHRVKAVEAEMKDLAGHMAKDVDLGQSTIDHMQESLSKFGDNFVSLSDTLKDLFSSQRTSGNREEELRRKVVAEVGSAKEILQHIRTNTNSHNKTLQNLMWVIQELHTGGEEQESGKVSGQGGSRLALLGVAIENQATSISENLIQMGHNVQEAVEKGVDPSKSYKRKREEQEMEQFKKAKEEMEKRKRDQPSLMIHPFTGEHLMLNAEQKRQLQSDLQHATPEQFACGSMASGKGGKGGAVLFLPQYFHFIQVSVL